MGVIRIDNKRSSSKSLFIHRSARRQILAMILKTITLLANDEVQIAIRGKVSPCHVRVIVLHPQRSRNLNHPPVYIYIHLVRTYSHCSPTCVSQIEFHLPMNVCLCTHLDTFH